MLSEVISVNVLERLDNIIEKLLEFLITLSLGFVVIITFLQVLFRYVFNQPLTWSQEALMIAFVYSVLFGAAIAMKNGEHLKVEIFEKLPKTVRIIFNTLEFIVIATMLIILFCYGLVLVQNNLTSGQTMSMLPIKMGYVYMVMPISSAFMMYYHIRKVFR